MDPQSGPAQPEQQNSQPEGQAAPNPQNTSPEPSVLPPQDAPKQPLNFEGQAPEESALSSSQNPTAHTNASESASPSAPATSMEVVHPVTPATAEPSDLGGQTEVVISEGQTNQIRSILNQNPRPQSSHEISSVQQTPITQQQQQQQKQQQQNVSSDVQQTHSMQKSVQQQVQNPQDPSIMVANPQEYSAYAAADPNYYYSALYENNVLYYMEPFFKNMAACLRTIHRWQSQDIKRNVEVFNAAPKDLPDFPSVFSEDVYQEKINPANWRPEFLEKVYSEVFVRDQKYMKDIKCPISAFKQYAQSPTDSAWCSKDIPIMHGLSCLKSEKNTHCLGCSNYWKTVQTITDSLRPGGPQDLLQYEADHIETFMGFITMNGSFQPQQRDALGCDVVNTLYYANDPNSIVLWGFIPPSELYKFTESDVLGFSFFDQSTFVDPEYLTQKGIKMYYAEQKVGQTVFIPSGWIYWSISMGNGLLFSASWNILQLKNLIEARKMMETNRELGVYKPINLSSVVYHYALYQMEEYSMTSDPAKRYYLHKCLQTVLPVLQTIVAEELLGERINLSSFVTIAYDFISHLKKSRPEIPIELKEQILLAGGTDNLWNPGENLIASTAVNDPDDVTLTCEACKCIIFNTRRACKICPRGFDVCEHCYPRVGKEHPHEMEKIRKIDNAELLRVMERAYSLLYNTSTSASNTTGGGATSPRDLQSHALPLGALHPSVSGSEHYLMLQHAATGTRLPHAAPAHALTVSYNTTGSLVPPLTSLMHPLPAMHSPLVPASGAVHLSANNASVNNNNNLVNISNLSSLSANSSGASGMGNTASAASLHGLGPLGVSTGLKEGPSAPLQSAHDERLAPVSSLSERPKRRPAQPPRAAASGGQQQGHHGHHSEYGAPQYEEPHSPNYDEDEIIDCICGNNKDLGFMISCEKCLAWLHGKCVGISKRNEPEKYFCPRCEKKIKLEQDLKATNANSKKGFPRN